MLSDSNFSETMNIEGGERILPRESYHRLGLEPSSGPLGGHVYDQSLTIVLPLHNSERQLRSSMRDVLDLAPTLRRPLRIVLVDDGSTDDTYETACEIARRYPQIMVLRQAVRQGLGAALELVRNRLSLDRVLVHDGFSTIDADQLQMMIQSDEDAGGATESSVFSKNSSLDSCGSRRFAAVRDLHSRLEQAHRTNIGFRWLQLEKPLIPRRCHTATPSSDPCEVATTTTVPIAGVGIPVGMNLQPQ